MTDELKFTHFLGQNHFDCEEPFVIGSYVHILVVFRLVYMTHISVLLGKKKLTPNSLLYVSAVVL